MSWGIRITLMYVFFVVLIVSMVFVSSGNKSELVAKDYYAQELKYQDRINAIENESKLEESIQCSLQKDSIVFTRPVTLHSKDFSGEILFFRPSDSSKDLRLKMDFTKTGIQYISKKLLSKGVYKICLSWKSNAKNYYREQIVTI